MPHIPPGVSGNILANFNKDLIAWMDGAEIPENGPHTKVIAQYGCTINKDFEVAPTRCIFKKGMQGHWIGEEKNGLWPWTNYSSFDMIQPSNPRLPGTRFLSRCS